MKSSWAGGLLRIDLDAIAANWRMLRDFAKPALCAAVVKADGYGLGATPVSLRLQREGCRHFFVAHLNEGALLRPHLMRESAIYVLNGPPPGACADLEQHGLIPVLNSLEQIAEWQALSRKSCRPLGAVLQFDTGMSRFGLSPDELQGLAREPSRLDGIVPVLLMSHLACADTPAHSANAEQRSRFVRGAALIPGIRRSLAASSGTFLGPDYHFDMIRPGAALYGVGPVPGRPNPMQPAIRLQGRIVQTRWVAGGASVGYGAHFTAPTPSRIATVAIGYADGLLRAAGGRGAATLSCGDTSTLLPPALLPPALLPIVGRISMDSLALDVTALGDRELAPGTLVDLIGPHRPLDDLAASAGTIGYEILTALGSRYHRHYVGAQEVRKDGEEDPA